MRISFETQRADPTLHSGAPEARYAAPWRADEGREGRDQESRLRAIWRAL
jgi:hypothetical protein